MASTRTLLVVAVVATALLGAAGTALAVDGEATPGSMNNTITVDGSGQVEVAPDAAVVRVSVTASGPDAGNVSSQIAADAESLREAVAAFGLNDSAIRTLDYDVRSDRDRRGDGETRYVGRQSFAITLSEVDRAGAFIDAAVEAGADDVHGVEFTLSESARESARDRALRNAVDDARGEATVLAEAAGLESTGVHSVSASSGNVHPYRTEAVAMADGAAGGTQIGQRDVTVTATVRVVFAATSA